MITTKDAEVLKPSVFAIDRHANCQWPPQTQASFGAAGCGCGDVQMDATQSEETKLQLTPWPGESVLGDLSKEIEPTGYQIAIFITIACPAMGPSVLPSLLRPTLITGTLLLQNEGLPHTLACPAPTARLAWRGRVQGVGWEFKRFRCVCVEE